MVKCIIEYDRLEALVKEHIEEVGAKYKHLDDYGVIEEYKSFYIAVAVESAKLNPVALAKVAKNLFKLPCHDATTWSGIVARAFNVARIAWGKASTGAKLPAAVRDVSLAMQAGRGQGDMPYVSCRATAPLERGRSSSHMKQELSSPPPSKRLKQDASAQRKLEPVISSPSAVLRLYAAPAIKQEKVPVKQEQVLGEVRA
jgi:hypothetical protein